MVEKDVTGADLGEASRGMEDDYITGDMLEAMRKSDNPPVIIDLREAPQKPQYRIEGAITITMHNLLRENVEKAVPNKDTPVVLVCDQSFEMTRMVALTTYAYPTLKLMGYTCVKILRNFP